MLQNAHSIIWIGEKKMSMGITVLHTMPSCLSLWFCTLGVRFFGGHVHGRRWLLILSVTHIATRGILHHHHDGILVTLRHTLLFWLLLRRMLKHFDDSSDGGYANTDTANNWDLALLSQYWSYKMLLLSHSSTKGCCWVRILRQINQSHVCWFVGVLRASNRFSKSLFGL